jgi:hypothetical protein
METKAASDELRFNEREVKLSNQQIVEFAYLTKELIEIALGEKLFFEQANCYFSCYYTIRDLLKQVDDEYLAAHRRLSHFYRGTRELLNDEDRLRWVPAIEKRDSCFETLSEIPF